MALLDVNNKHCFLPGSPISDDIILMAKGLLMLGEIAVMSPELAILYDWKTPPVGQVPPPKLSTAGKALSQMTHG